MPDPDSDFLPTATWPYLQRRAAITAAVRRFFAARNFVEVDTPLLSHDTVVDLHLEPFVVAELSAHQRHTVGFLQTSPEFGMKRLLAAGATAIFQVTRAFRAAECGPLHNPEFTIVEWYRVGDSMFAGMELLDALVQEVLGCAAAERLTYADAFQHWVGLDPHTCALDELARAAHRHGLQAGAPWAAGDRDAWLDWLLVTCVEPHLGAPCPTLLYDYPASQAALARVRNDPVPVAERFELYVNGVELANGYHELTDPDELRQRARSINQQRAARGLTPLPEQNRLIAAMRHGIPPCTGVALGLDRLVMIATGATELRQVMAFPFDRA